MTSIQLLLLILLLSLLLVGRRQGWLVFLSICLNFGALFLFLSLTAWGLPALLLLVIINTVILSITVFFSSADLKITLPAFYSSLLVIGITIGLTVLVIHWSVTYGFGAEDSDDLQGMSTSIGTNFMWITLATLTVCNLGAIAEAAIAISSGIQEVSNNHPHLPFKKLFSVGMHIGQQIIGTTFNTLFFGFFGGLLSLFTWFASLHYSLAAIINNQIMGGELVNILISFISVLLTIPITSVIACHFQRKFRIAS